MLNQLLYTLIPIITGIILLGVYQQQKRKYDRLKASGMRAEGIVFALSGNSSINTNSNLNSSLPTIRFVTNKGEWITKEYFIGSSAFKQPQKVQVLYNPENPIEFVLEANATAKLITNFILPIVGIATIVFGLFNTYQFKLW
ncbi:MAG: DUF3592 domain-containing protein, partial [Chitinophagaceae bacterium]